MVTAVGVPAGVLTATQAQPALGWLAARRHVVPPGSRRRITACRERDQGSSETRAPTTHPSSKPALRGAAWVIPSLGTSRRRRRMGMVAAASSPEHRGLPAIQNLWGGRRALHHQTGTQWLGHSKPRGHHGVRAPWENKTRGIHQLVLSTHQTPNGVTGPRSPGQGDHIFFLLIIFHLLARQR